MYNKNNERRKKQSLNETSDRVKTLSMHYCAKQTFEVMVDWNLDNMVGCVL